MLFLTLLFAAVLPTSLSTDVISTNGVLDPVKDFYNKKILEAAVQSLKPLTKVMVQHTSIELKKDHVRMAPQWLQESLSDIFGLENGGRFDVVRNIWQKFAVQIIGLFQDGIKKELDIVLVRFEVNMEANMLDVVRSQLEWRKLKKRGMSDWYRNQIEKLIQMALPLLNDAAHKTTLQTKDDYGNRVGDLARTTLNAFLPEDLQIPNLSETTKNKMKLAGIGSYVREKLIAFVKLLQSKIRSFTGKAFEQFEKLIKAQIELEVRRVVKERVPFY